MGWIACAIAVLALLAVWWQGRRRTAALEDRLAASAHALESLERAFTRFAPATVVDEIAAHGTSTRSEKKEITVLFADLKGFTAIGETLAPDVLVTVVNGYFARMSQAIALHRGHLAKFIGDGVMVLFGALEPNPWQTNDALHAALAMRTALDAYNTTLTVQDLPPLAVGIGIHRGPAVAGVIGTDELMEYGVIGSTVNLAARVQTLTRTHDADILVTDPVRATADPRFRLRPLPPIDVKGFPTPIPTYALDAFVPEPS